MSLKTNLIIVIATLCILLSCKEEPKADTHGKPTSDLPIKGFMIDAARTVANMDHYYRIVDFCSENGFNTIHFRLTDDEGCAMQFKSRPDLIHHEGAFSAEELKQFVAYAKERGIEVLPEVETFGHTKFITEVEKYHYLQDILDTTIVWANGICPVHDTTLAIMKDLIREVAAIFPSEYLHIGCDETNWGGNELTKKALEETPKIEIWARYVNQLNALVKENGKKSIIWADVPLREEHEILDLLDKDIVLMDWNYWYTSADSVRANAEKMMNGGFSIMGSPAINWMMWGPRIGDFQLRNIKAFSDAYNGIDSEKNLGVVFTHWCPYRFTPNAQWDSYYLAAKILNNPDYANNGIINTLKKFVEEHYGAQWNEDWENIFHDLYTYTPKNKYHGEDVGVKPFYPWRNKEDLKEVLAKEKPFEFDFAEVVERIKMQEANITKNKEDFDEFLLSAECLKHFIWRESRLFAIKDNPEEMTNVIKEIAEADQDLLERLEAIWKKDRKGEMDDKHIWEFPKATAFSESLVNDSSQLKDVLKSQK